MADIILTWPKYDEELGTRTLESYLAELEIAEQRSRLINFRIAARPTVSCGERCFMVHDGAVRGWNTIFAATYRGGGDVARVIGGSFAGFWREGWYVARYPRWHALDEPIPMRGFQGFRYMERERV